MNELSNDQTMILDRTALCIDAPRTMQSIKHSTGNRRYDRSTQLRSTTIAHMQDNLLFYVTSGVAVR